MDEIDFDTISRPLPPTEKVLREGLNEKWADINFKKRFSSVKASRKFRKLQVTTAKPEKEERVLPSHMFMTQ